MNSKNDGKTGFTPEPWEWIEGDEPTHRELIATADKGQGADSILYHGANWRITPANARLIQAAPELVVALESLMGLERTQGVEDDVWETAWATADALLARIREEQ